MGFLSGLFGGGSKSSQSAPAKLTEEQVALQKQAVKIGELQTSNVQRQTDFQQNIFAQLMQSLGQRGSTQRSLFGSSAPLTPIGGAGVPSTNFGQQRNDELEEFKRQLVVRRSQRSSGLNL